MGRGRFAGPSMELPSWAKSPRMLPPTESGSSPLARLASRSRYLSPPRAVLPGGETGVATSPSAGRGECTSWEYLFWAPLPKASSITPVTAERAESWSSGCGAVAGLACAACRCSLRSSVSPSGCAWGGLGLVLWPPAGRTLSAALSACSFSFLSFVSIRLFWVRLSECRFLLRPGWPLCTMSQTRLALYLYAARSRRIRRRTGKYSKRVVMPAC